MIRNRLWYELCQAKHNGLYCVALLARKRRLMDWFNIIILLFSSAGIMGWKLWDTIPLIACGIISGVQILRLLQPHFIPTDKQIDKLDSIVDFYFEYFNKIEQLWFDYDQERITEHEMQIHFYTIKDTEKAVNKVINEIVKSANKSIRKKCEDDARIYLNQTFNTA